MYYKYKDNLYYKIRELKIKIGDDWVEGVQYANDDEFFVRTKEDFEANFEPTTVDTVNVKDFIYYGKMALKGDTLDEYGDIHYARWVMSMMDIPATLSFDVQNFINQHILLCNYEDVPHRVVGISRLGDVFITDNFQSTSYNKRVPVDKLKNFRKGYIRIL